MANIQEGTGRKMFMYVREKRDEKKVSVGDRSNYLNGTF